MNKIIRTLALITLSILLPMKNSFGQLRQQQRQQQQHDALGVRQDLPDPSRFVVRTFVAVPHIAQPAPTDGISFEGFLAQEQAEQQEPAIAFSFDRFSAAMDSNDIEAAFNELGYVNAQNTLNTLPQAIIIKLLTSMINHTYTAQTTEQQVACHQLIERFVSINTTSSCFILCAAASHGDLALLCRIMCTLAQRHQRTRGIGPKAALIIDASIQLNDALHAAIEHGHWTTALYLYTGTYGNPAHPEPFIARAASLLSRSELIQIRQVIRNQLEAMQARLSAIEQSLSTLAQNLSEEENSAEKQQLTIKKHIAERLLKMIETKIKDKMSMR